MALETIHRQVIPTDLIEPTSLQFDEEHHAIYALTNSKLTRIDLNNNNVEIVRQHNRRFGGINEDNVDEYSQGEFDDEENNRVSNPNEDSELSTDDDEQTMKK